MGGIRISPLVVPVPTIGYSLNSKQSRRKESGDLFGALSAEEVDTTLSR